MDPVPRFPWVDPAKVAGADAGPLPTPTPPGTGPTPPGSTSEPPEPRKSRAFIVSSAAISFGGLLVAFLLGRSQDSNVASYLVILASMALFMLAIGREIIGLWLGILIDERNVMSLARLQAVLWTAVILSGFLTAALIRIRANVPDPLLIQIDWHLWALLGISVTSLAGSALILDGKRDKEVKDAETVAAAADKLGMHPVELEQTRQGTLYNNPSPSDARFADLFQGDEVGNGAQIDLGKVQLFYFTVVAVLAYAVQLGQMFHSLAPGEISSLPVLPDGLVALLGISHAGFLGTTAVDHTETK